MYNQIHSCKIHCTKLSKILNRLYRTAFVSTVCIYCTCNTNSFCMGGIKYSFHFVSVCMHSEFTSSLQYNHPISDEKVELVVKTLQ